MHRNKNVLSKGENLPAVSSHAGEQTRPKISRRVRCKACLRPKRGGYSCKENEDANGSEALVHAVRGLVSERKDAHDEKGSGSEL